MEDAPKRSNFIWDFIDEDIRAGKNGGRVHTRFPPEPNGYLHIGHTKAMYIDFVTAKRYGGLCNLRFDDTNPAKEETEFVDGVMEDIHWMGFDWDGGLFFASEYYEQCYDYAVDLIRRGLAYVDELSPEELRAYRGTLTQPGKNSPWRDRPMAESLDLFTRMRAGEFPDGSLVLRAKIDMASPNINMRDPTLYRILHRHHIRTGNDWCIYPMYDFAHPIGDALEGITHSLCSLEYEDHRPLYDWVVKVCGFENPPRQIEFARLNLTRTVMSKRYLRRLVEEGYVSGWDDPRMPTLAAMRRRGYTPAAIFDFIERSGISKASSEIDLALLEHCVRDNLGEVAPRAMAVLHPLKVVLTNWPEGETDAITLENHPAHPEMGTHTANFGRVLYIEQEDFMEDAPKKFFRLKPGGEVRLKGAYIIRCDEVIKDENGAVVELRCTVDLDSRSGSAGAERKVKGTLHWVNAAEALPFEARLYEPLLLDEAGIEEDAEGDEAAPAKKDFIARLNPESLETLSGCLAEPWLAEATDGQTYQFMRLGYFCKDKDGFVFNRTVGLKDGFKKAQ
ncbi:MAG: glutamine--tRNA ligase/YqeY domain fusion protein [Oscillospiraceae bacterium]|jgi:glutaminyl-tRNA synthetase|nr:glutamine--tRNA ligase/YqeY domain fusion protein [Oscillospiraceae bacterium]